MGQNPFFVYVFNQMQIDMDNAAGQHYKTPFDANENRISCLFQQVVALYNLDLYEESIKTIHELLDFIDSCKDGRNRTAYKISAYEKLSMTYLDLERDEESENALIEIFKLRNDLPPIDEESNHAYIGVLDAICRLSLRAQISGDAVLLKKYMDVALSIADKVNYDQSGQWITAFTLCGRFATYFEEIDVEKSINYYQEAFSLAEDHNLTERYSGPLSVLYNNYGWVLWNKCDSFEAIGPYSRCLDLLEAMARKGKEKNVESYRHTVDALLKIYESGNMQKEAERLKERLEKYEKK